MRFKESFDMLLQPSRWTSFLMVPISRKRVRRTSTFSTMESGIRGGQKERMFFAFYCSVILMSFKQSYLSAITGTVKNQMFSIVL